MLKYNLNEAFQMRWLSGVGREEGAFFVALYGTLDNASVLTIPHNDTIPSSSELLKRGQEKREGRESGGGRRRGWQKGDIKRATRLHHRTR
jgi:hypothetical protein